jgi:DNA-directed RNA polymerase subunit beta'
MVEIDEQTGFQVISESRAKKLIPTLLVYGKDGELIRSYNLVAHLMVENGEKIKAGKVLVKIPRRSSKSEITEVYQELLS